jgi:hypothetical protein
MHVAGGAGQQPAAVGGDAVNAGRHGGFHQAFAGFAFGFGGAAVRRNEMKGDHECEPDAVRCG